MCNDEQDDIGDNCAERKGLSVPEEGAVYEDFIVWNVLTSMALG